MCTRGTGARWRSGPMHPPGAVARRWSGPMQVPGAVARWRSGPCHPPGIVVGPLCAHLSAVRWVHASIPPAGRAGAPSPAVRAPSGRVTGGRKGCSGLSTAPWRCPQPLGAVHSPSVLSRAAAVSLTGDCRGRPWRAGGSRLPRRPIVPGGCMGPDQPRPPRPVRAWGPTSPGHHARYVHGARTPSRCPAATAGTPRPSPRGGPGRRLGPGRRCAGRGAGAAGPNTGRAGPRPRGGGPAGPRPGPRRCLALEGVLLLDQGADAVEDLPVVHGGSLYCICWWAGAARCHRIGHANPVLGPGRPGGGTAGDRRRPGHRSRAGDAADPL
jgi:hypothetical protein